MRSAFQDPIKLRETTIVGGGKLIVRGQVTATMPQRQKLVVRVTETGDDGFQKLIVSSHRVAATV